MTDRFSSIRKDDLLGLVKSGEIPSSAEENNYCGFHARFVEDRLEHPRCVYFYAGRAYPEYGRIALAFSKDIEKDVFISATPFDTGGLVRDPNEPVAGFQLNLVEITLDSRVQYCKDALITKPEWRNEFARWLAYYFPDNTEGYWLGRPAIIDPESLYDTAHQNEWQAWAWEVRLKRGPNPLDAVGWACDVGYLNSLDEKLLTGLLTEDQMTAFEDFRERILTPVGSKTFCEDIESWIREVCRSAS